MLCIGSLVPAVVHEVHDERLAAETELVEVIEEPPDDVVEAGDVRVIGARLDGELLRCVELRVPFRRIPRHVRKHRSDQTKNGCSRCRSMKS
jgi:hypothetical protein